jgi:hypothetical protein
MPGFIIGKGGGENVPRGNMEVHRSYRWALRSINMGTSFRVNSANNTIVEIDLPKLMIEELKVAGINNEYKFAKKVTFGDVSMQFYDFEGLYEELEKLVLKVYDLEEGIKTDYKGTIELDQLDNDGKKTNTWKFIGAWPKELSHSKLSYKDDSLKLIDMTFSYDYYEHS